MAGDDVKLIQYQIVKLNWELNGEFNGTLQVEPEIEYALPADRRPLIRCRYKLDISGIKNDALRLAVTAEGIFEVKELPESEPGVLDRKQMTPITDIMEQKLIESVGNITKSFDVPEMVLELVPPKK